MHLQASEILLGIVLGLLYPIVPLLVVYYHSSLISESYFRDNERKTCINRRRRCRPLIKEEMAEKQNIMDEIEGNLKREDPEIHGAGGTEVWANNGEKTGGRGAEDRLDGEGNHGGENPAIGVD